MVALTESVKSRTARSFGYSNAFDSGGSGSALVGRNKHCRSLFLITPREHDNATCRDCFCQRELIALTTAVGSIVTCKKGEMVGSCGKLGLTVEQSFRSVKLHSRGEKIVKLNRHGVLELSIGRNIMVETDNIPHQLLVSLVTHQLITDVEHLTCKTETNNRLNVLPRLHHDAAVVTCDCCQKSVLSVHLLIERILGQKIENVVRHDFISSYQISSR